MPIDLVYRNSILIFMYKELKTPKITPIMAKALKIKKVKKIGRISSNLRYGKSTPMLESNGRAQHTGSVSPVEVMNVLISAKGGRDITNYKSQAFSTGSIQPRKLISVTDLMTEGEKEMYIQLCKLAAQ